MLLPAMQSRLWKHGRQSAGLLEPPESGNKGGYFLLTQMRSATVLKRRDLQLVVATKDISAESLAGF